VTRNQTLPRRVYLSNIFFVSTQEDLGIAYLKCTVKFDNNGTGKARFSFKIRLESKEWHEIPRLFLVVRNTERVVSLLRVDTSYNKFLGDIGFRRAAGIEDIKQLNEQQEYITQKLVKFEEDPNLKEKILVIPRTIHVDRVDLERIPSELHKYFNSKDIILEILPVNKVVFESLKTFSTRNFFFEFQFRIFLADYLVGETLDAWKASSEAWSAEIDIHKERGFEDFKGFLGNRLKYPEFLDLWINIPHNHLFIASSPAYKNAIKLKTEDIEYKTYQKSGQEDEFHKMFETKEGDYSVRIGNSSGRPEDFSLICYSPFLPGEEPRKLREDLNISGKRSKELEESLRNSLRELETYQQGLLRNMVGIFGIFVAIFSFITISADYVLQSILPFGEVSLRQTFLQVSAFFLPIFLFLIALMIISMRMTRN
jgi:hypothetical protein